MCFPWLLIRLNCFQRSTCHVCSFFLNCLFMPFLCVMLSGFIINSQVFSRWVSVLYYICCEMFLVYHLPFTFVYGVFHVLYVKIWRFRQQIHPPFFCVCVSFHCDFICRKWFLVIRNKLQVTREERVWGAHELAN